MLTSPLQTITEQVHHGTGFIRNTKDWIAERIANNILVNRLAPYSSSSESDDDDYYSRKTSKHSMSTIENGRGGKYITLSKKFYITDNVSHVSVRSARKHKKRVDQSRLFKYNMPALKAVQAIETVKMRTDRHGSFK